MRRTTRILMLGVMLAGKTAAPLMSQAPRPYRIGDIRITGNKQLNDVVIKAILSLASGDVYDESKLRNGLDNLRKLYGSRGYVNFTAAPVQDVDEQKKVVNLTINIDEDRMFHVRHIMFSGNTTITDEMIRRELAVKEGNIFDSTLWDLSIQRLNQLGYFDPIKNGDVRIRPSATEPVLDITVTVKEKERK